MVLGRRRKSEEPLTKNELIDAAGVILTQAKLILDALTELEEGGSHDDERGK